METRMIIVSASRIGESDRYNVTFREVSQPVTPGSPHPENLSFTRTLTSQELASSLNQTFILTMEAE